MNIAAFLFRCRRTFPTSAVVACASIGFAVGGFDASFAVAQTGGSAYSAPSGPQNGPPPGAPTEPRPDGTSEETSAPSAPPADSAAPASNAAPAQKNAAAAKIETFYSAKNPDVVGENLGLERLLNGVYSPSERRRRLTAYWDLAGRRAYCNLCVECAVFATNCADRVQKKYEGATVPPEIAALVAASRLVALQRREAARLDFVRNQRAFDAAFSSAAARRASWIRRSNEARTAAEAARTNAGADAAKIAEKAAANVGTPTSPILYVPSDAPSFEPYETRFDEMSRRRRLSSEAARLNAELPLLYQATRSRAEQARAEMANLSAAFNAPETPEVALFAALDRYLFASREALAAATRYNRAIAAYVAETVPGTLRGAALLATLNRRVAASKPQNAPLAAARKTFVDDDSRIASSAYVAPEAAAPAVAAVSFVEPVSQPDLTPTPGARLEPDDASSPAPLAAASETSSAPAEPLPSEPTPAPTEPASAPTPAPTEPTSADANGPTTIVVTGYERDRPAPSNAAPEQNGTPGAAISTRTFQNVAAVSAARIVRGQAPEPAAEAPAQTPATPAPTPAAPGRDRVRETVAALFATPKPEPSPNGGSNPPLEVATTLRAALERVSPSERAATAGAFWRLQGASARLAVENEILATLTQAFNELNAKKGDAGAETAARLYLAAALGAQARVAEARAGKRDAQIALVRRLRWNLNEGWPIPATLPFVGATYRLETPSAATNPTLALEGATIPENLKALNAIGAAFGAPATLCRFDVPPTSAADPLVALATLEKKRESVLLFVELVVATNVSIAEYVANYPAGFVSVDRYVDALVGPGK